MENSPPKLNNPTRNRTTTISDADEDRLRRYLAPEYQNDAHEVSAITLVNGDSFKILPTLPGSAFDLLIADPPYNLTKRFGTSKFSRTSVEDYEAWLDSWLRLCVPLLKPMASVYICGDWRSSSAIERVGSRYFTVRNRITWEREKGRGAKSNWKNASEDIWFFTVGDRYTFNLDAVKQRRRVLAPYREAGEPKDWTETANGKFRDTHPSNLWTDVTVPFWSMPENTEHPTQKPEKLLAKLILASTSESGLILDPFAGSGTTAVVAKKLGRKCVAIESDENYCLLAAKRLEMADSYPTIQGFADGVFWDRNSGR